MSNGSVTYWEYLEIDNLLSMQSGVERKGDVLDADEMHFIVVHQVYELWFKLFLTEMEYIRGKLDISFIAETVIPDVVHHLNRCNEILKLASQQFKLMETLTPQDFHKFRAKLGTASGFQSMQMREIEIILGLNDADRSSSGNIDPIPYILKMLKGRYGDKVKKNILKRQNERTVKECVDDWLYRTPILGSEPDADGDIDIVEGFIEEYIESLKEENNKHFQMLVADEIADKKMEEDFALLIDQASEFLRAKDVEERRRRKISRIRVAILFIEVYRNLPLLAWPRSLMDTIVELEELFINFRFNHARMVERIIGRRIGTGGSSGVDYLDSTVKYRIFKDLWFVRSILVPKNALPEVKNIKGYGFVRTD